MCYFHTLVNSLKPLLPFCRLLALASTSRTMLNDPGDCRPDHFPPRCLESGCPFFLSSFTFIKKRCRLIIPCTDKNVRSLKLSCVAGEQTKWFSPLENNFTVSYEVKHKLISQQSHSKKNENRYAHTHTKPLYANV